MRKVKSIKAIGGEDTYGEETKNFEITLTDKSKSPVSLVKDGEWVMQGDDRQRFCLSELRAISREIVKLNKKRKPTRKGKAKKSKKKRR